MLHNHYDNIEVGEFAVEGYIARSKLNSNRAYADVATRRNREFDTMRPLAFAFACVFALSVGSLPASAEQSLPPVEEKLTLEDLESLPEPGTDLKALPPANTESVVAPKAVFRRGCIPFPGARRSFVVTIPPRRTTRYAVTPNRFFDVVLAVRSVGRVFRADRFFAGGTEVIRLFNPNFFRLSTRVTISGFRGSTGCWAFSATP